MLEDWQEKLEREGKVILQVKIKSGASKNQITDIKNGVINISIKAAADKGKANKELLRFLSKQFRVDAGNIKIIKGATTHQKSIKVVI